MTETIISYLAMKADAINTKIDALENEAWGDRYFQRSNTLHDSLDAQMDAIATYPAEDQNDATIQLQIALKTLRIVNGSDTACQMTEKAEKLIENALPGLEKRLGDVSVNDPLA